MDNTSTEASVDLSVLKCVICDVNAYTVTVFCVGQHESGARNDSVTVYSKRSVSFNDVSPIMIWKLIFIHIWITLAWPCHFTEREQVPFLYVMFYRSLVLCVMFCRSLVVCVMLCRYLVLCVMLCRYLVLCVVYTGVL
jgi:hypothetical protein